MSVRFLIGDARSRLKELPDESVHCVVTSPPYFGLRDYGTAQWEGGDPACDHKAPSRFDYALNSGLGPTGVQTQGSNAGSGTVQQFRSVCGKCGARRIDSQIGLEATPAAYVAELVAVFREVRRVLRSDGTVWLNLGDSYAGGKTGRTDGASLPRPKGGSYVVDHGFQRPVPPGLKPKDLIGVPWRVAFALQDDGWWLRQDLIWAKPNPMPESVTDRCTKSHEYVFLLTKSASYAYDAEAIKEAQSALTLSMYGHRDNGEQQRVSLGTREARRVGAAKEKGLEVIARNVNPDGLRNRRSVWTIATAPFSEAHFATFPPELPELCIRAGTSERGCCPRCGKGWARVVERGELTGRRTNPGQPAHLTPQGYLREGKSRCGDAPSTTLGWQPSCSCPAHEPQPCTVLDCFAGAGTTGLVADRLGRNAILIELNPEYAAMARTRLEADAGMFACLEAAE